jgi:hypothetical protein
MKKPDYTLLLIYVMFGVMIAFPLGILVLQVLGYIPIQDSIYYLPRIDGL